MKKYPSKVLAEGRINHGKTPDGGDTPPSRKGGGGIYG